MRPFLSTAVLMCALAAGFAVFAADSQTEVKKEPIKIALVGPMTGSVASFGELMKSGAVLAVKNINAQGGVLGRPLELEVMDDACDPKQAVTVANKIISENILFVNGHACSGATLAAMSVYADSDVLMITPDASNPNIADGKHWNIFRVWPSDAEEGALMADYIASHYPSGNVAIIDDKQTFSKSIVGFLKSGLQKHHITISMEDSITAGEKDYSAVVTKIIAENPSVFFYSGYQAEAGLIVRQLREHGSHIPIMAADTVLTPDFYAITGKYGEGVKFASVSKPEDMKGNKALQEMLAHKKAPSDIVALYTYATMQLMADAIAKAGTLDTHKIADLLHHEKFPTVLGDGAFDSKGSFIGPSLQVYEWRNGKVTKVNE